MELLAPAGNFASLYAAVANGADAVYLAYEKYGARASAANFNAQELARAVRFAHLHGVKIHLTVNTLLKDSELDDALDIVKFALELGVDAFIVQDLGLIERIRTAFPTAVLHASTQMGICNPYGARFAQDLGCSRVVLARETLPEDIATIAKSGIETEVFCQGALCVAYSGNCYYSSMVSGCSGNRGKCLQLCRKKYKIGNTYGYFLSAKDICLLDKIDTLKEWGVTSVKIEGRMRSPEYVAEAVAVYRAAIDGHPYKDGTERLKKVFNRGDYCDAYMQAPTERIIYPKVQNHIGVPIGKVASVRNGIATLRLTGQARSGDGVKYLRDGYEVGGGLLDGATTRVPNNVRVGDEVRLTAQTQLRNAVADLYPRVPVVLSVRLQKDSLPCMELTCRNTTVTVCGDQLVQTAMTRALTEEDIRTAVGTLGGTDFFAKDIRVSVDENIFYPAAAIKDMRRRLVQKAEERLLSALPQKSAPAPYRFPPIRYFPCENTARFVVVPHANVLHSLRFSYNHVILHPSDYAEFSEIKQQCEALQGKALLWLPLISRGKDVPVLIRCKELPIAGVVANNVGHLPMFSDMPIVGGIGLNKLNDTRKGLWINSIERDTVCTGIRYAYGKLPYMHFAHCPKQTQGGTCKDCKGYSLTMQDEKGAVLELHRSKQYYCYGVLCPQIPVNTIDTHNGMQLLDLSYATDAEIEAVNGQMQGKPYTLPFMRGYRNFVLQ